MPLNPAFIVCVERKPGAFGGTMNEIRTWLDHCKIQPASFKPVALADSSVGFEISFNARLRLTFSRTLFAPQPGSPSFANAADAFASPAPCLARLPASGAGTALAARGSTGTGSESSQDASSPRRM